MNERDWKLLKLLYEKKSITHAADALFMSQPALSIRLKNIESYFNTPIVIRTKKGIQFTAEGEYLAQKSYDMLNDLDTVKEHVQSMQETVSGTIRIGASNFVCKYLLPPLLRQFQDAYPGVDFQVYSGWSRNIMNLVAKNNVHMAFIRGDYHFSGERLLLFKDVMCVVNAGEIPSANLDQYPLIEYQNDPPNQLLINRWWIENYSTPPRIRMQVDRLDTCLEMVKYGLGYGFLPSSVLHIAPDLYHEPLRLKSGNLCERDTWLFYHKDAYELNQVKAFVSMIEKIELERFIAH